LRMPHAVLSTRFNPSASDADDWHRLSSYPILDEVFFTQEKWRLDKTLDENDVNALEDCGPDFVLASSGLWENLLWSPKLETVRCGLKNSPFDLEAHLYERRLRTLFTEVCNRYGVDRFVWRTSAVPLSPRYPTRLYNSNFKSTPELNRKSLKVATEFHIFVMDYQKLHENDSYLALDSTHPIDYTVCRALQNVFYHFENSKAVGLEHLLKLSGVINDHCEGLWQEWNSISGDMSITSGTDVQRTRTLFSGAFNMSLNKLGSDLQTLEQRGAAPWSVRKLR